MAGPTQSADFPTTPRSFQPVYAGGLKDVFVVKIGPEREPGVSFVPTTLTFPAQAIGTTSPPQTVLLHHVGSKALSIEGIQTVGMFAQTSTCSRSLAGGGSCAISIVFTPGAPGMQTGAVVINNDAQGSPQKLILTGTGAAEE